MGKDDGGILKTFLKRQQRARIQVIWIYIVTSDAMGGAGFGASYCVFVSIIFDWKRLNVLVYFGEIILFGMLFHTVVN